MYQFGEAIRPSDHFCATVLELVKLIQCGLSLFELFPIEPEEQNGLLCDLTVDGIQKWVLETGVPYMSLEVFRHSHNLRRHQLIHFHDSLQSELRIPPLWPLSLA